MEKFPIIISRHKGGLHTAELQRNVRNIGRVFNNIADAEGGGGINRLSQKCRPSIDK